MLAADRRHRDKFSFDELDAIVLGEYARVAHPVILINRQQAARGRRVAGQQAQFLSVHASLYSW
jgi:hypothetical protein